MNRNLLKLVTFCIAVISTVNVMAQNQFGGLALYTVRNAMGTDAKATLKSVAEIGYQNVEAAGYKDGKYYNMTPEDFKNYLKELNLRPISTHQSDINIDDADAMFADAKAAGFEYFVVPIPPMGLFKYYQETQSMGMEGGAENLAKRKNGWSYRFCRWFE